ncbi:MAG TPA: TlpA disulfide reductase family protein [Devosia sp.]|jgi:thiol-disulfide isomerase/thioredoxin|nr:TlpA disulfide reductase family protein [Devosia sp.]
MTEQEPEKPVRRVPRLAALAVLVIAAVAIAGGYYLSNPAPSGPPGCAPSAASVAAIDKAAFGSLAAVTVTPESHNYAGLTFEDETGKPAKLSDFAGKTLLVNFWASWCVPCRAEMPALANVAKKFDGPDFMVVPINLDIGEEGIGKAKKFLADNNITGLPLYADPSLKALDTLKDSGAGLGLPTTLLLDRKACEVAVLQGPAEWDGNDGENVVKALAAVKG